MTPDLFTPDFKSTPFWWERTPRPGDDGSALPKRADVVVVGLGYTGLSAAIEAARGGRHVVAVDAAAAGWGCSSRNGGQVSPSIKPDFAALTARFGAAAAVEILREGNNAHAWVERFIADNGIDCDYKKVGRFHGAHSRRAFDELQRKIAALPAELDIGAYAVPRAEQQRQVDSALYHGGVVYPRHGCLDPGRYHHGLLNCARAAGADLISHCAVRHIATPAAGQPIHITTTRGRISADHVIIATSGYTSGVTPWQRRRIIPIGSYVIATEALPAAQVARLIPSARVVTDTRRLVVYYRACPQGRRMIFGGRVSLRECHPRHSAARLHGEMTRLFPALKSTRISHSWMGWVGYTFDKMPHFGVHRRLHYSMGYCGSGISLSCYLGMRTARKVLGHRDAATALERAPFPSRPYYRRRPWFLAPTLFYYRWRDHRETAAE